MNERLAQAQKAIAEASIKEIGNRLHLANHDEATHSMERYGLPYRIYFDDIENIYRSHQYITEMYPLYRYPKDEVFKLTIHDFDKAAVVSIIKDYDCNRRYHTNSLGEQSIWHLGYHDLYCMETMKADIRKTILDHFESIRGWSLYDDNWKRYFLCYLQGYDFNTFTYFDFYGIPEDTDPQPLRDRYIQLQSEYDPSTHLEPIPETPEADQRNYDYRPYEIIWNEADTNEYNKLAEEYHEIVFPILGWNDPERKKIEAVVDMLM